MTILLSFGRSVIDSLLDASLLKGMLTLPSMFQSLNSSGSLTSNMNKPSSLPSWSSHFLRSTEEMFPSEDDSVKLHFHEFNASLQIPCIQTDLGHHLSHLS